MISPLNTEGQIFLSWANLRLFGPRYPAIPILIHLHAAASPYVSL